ncbi:MAG: SDR family oxidoreductase [Erysipelotrichaceae bacterium]
MNVNVVTGGGSGIGKAIVTALEKQETTVITGRNLDKLNKVADSLNQQGYHVIATTCDVSSLDDVKKLAEYAGSLGEVKKVFHCAGISGSMGSREKIIRTNACGTVHINREFYKVMNGGVICDVASDSAHMLPSILLPKDKTYNLILADEEKFVAAMCKKARMFRKEAIDVNIAYFISKNFVQWYVRKCAYKYLAEKNIRVFSISPGFVKTPMTDAEASEATETMFSYTGLHRGAEPEEIAFLALALADERCGYFVGADVLVDGGVVNNGYGMFNARKPYDKASLKENW